MEALQVYKKLQVAECGLRIDPSKDLPVDATPNDIAAWTIVSRVLLNLDETLCRP